MTDRFHNMMQRINQTPAYTECNIDAKGGKHYYKDGLRHRADGPAIIHKNGSVHYYIGGWLHREDGPAINYTNGHAWYLEGKEVDPETIVDLWLMRGVYCRYDEETEALVFDE